MLLIYSYKEPLFRIYIYIIKINRLMKITAYINYFVKLIKYTKSTIKLENKNNNFCEV